MQSPHLLSSSKYQFARYRTFSAGVNKIELDVMQQSYCSTTRNFMHKAKQSSVAAWIDRCIDNTVNILMSRYTSFFSLKYEINVCMPRSHNRYPCLKILISV